ncbi:hypothetical protein QTP88_001041 [Uroleucon formosanum]
MSGEERGITPLKVNPRGKFVGRSQKVMIINLYKTKMLQQPTMLIKEISKIISKELGIGQRTVQAISFVLYDTQDKAQEVRKKIVTHVINNWEDYSIMSHDSDGNNYRSSADYFSDMLKFNTSGGLCELVAAGQLFLVFIEVYLNGELYEKFGSERNPVKRFRFSSMQNLSNGHFDVYLLYEDELTNSVSDEFDNIPSSQKHTKKRRKRFTNNIRKKQLIQSATKYQLKNKEVHKVAAAKYKKKNPEVKSRSASS